MSSSFVQIQVKCYLFPCNAKPSLKSIESVSEIRRFDLTSNKSFDGLYDKLSEKIVATFGSLVPEKSALRTYWQDDENELVGFSSDAEMQYAIDLQTAIRSSANAAKPYDPSSRNSHMMSALFKVYICKAASSSEEDSSSSSSSPKSNVHFGVVCDGCNGRVAGVRHKCAICPDYDLCSDCRSKGIHRDTEHAFNKIEKPMSFWKSSGGRYCGGAKGTGGASRCPYKQQQGAAASAAAGLGASFAGFQEQFNQFLPQLAANIPLVNDPEQLKTFGENLKKFLDPFGVDVDYYVDNMKKASSPPTNDNKQQSAEAKKEEKKPEQPSATSKAEEKADETAAAGAAAAAGASSSAFASMESSMEKIDQDEAKLTPSESNEKLGMETGENDEYVNVSMKPAYPFPKESKGSASNVDAVRLQSSSPFSEVTNALKNIANTSNSNRSSQEQVTTPKYPFPKNPSTQTPAAEPAKEATSTTTTVDDSFSLNDIDKELKVIRAVEQLKTMGYSDEQGWLTRLVTVKDANINAVLDTLMPNN